MGILSLRGFLGASAAVDTRPGVRLESVQVMRALAALAVCLDHMFYQVTLFTPSPLMQSLGNVPLWTGVDLFFVISGFIMMHLSQGIFGTPHAGTDFIKRRLIRIVPSYWFFTSLMVVATLVFPKQLNVAVFEINHVIMSYLFIPHFNPGEAGLLQPVLGLGWTLVYEMFFYLAFAACLFLAEGRGLLTLTVLFIALFAAAKAGLWNDELNVFWGNSILFNFLAGIAMAKIFEYKGLKKGHILALNMVLVLALLGSVAAGIFFSERFFNTGIAAVMIFSVLFYLPSRPGWFWRGLVLIGDASYALYLSHPFVLVITKQALGFLHLLGGGFMHITLYCIVTLTCALAGAVFFYLWIEKPTTKYLLGKAFPRRLA